MNDLLNAFYVAILCKILKDGQTKQRMSGTDFKECFLCINTVTKPRLFIDVGLFKPYGKPVGLRLLFQFYRN